MIQLRVLHIMPGFGGVLRGGAGFVGADGHRDARHLRDELFDEALTVLVHPDEVPEGLAAVDEYPGAVEVSLRLAQVAVEHRVLLL